MDSTNAAQLDPKLKEVYESVLGGPTTPPPDSKATSIPTVSPTPQQIVDSVLEKPNMASDTKPAETATQTSTPEISHPTLKVEEVIETHKVPPAELTQANTVATIPNQPTSNTTPAVNSSASNTTRRDDTQPTDTSKEAKAAEVTHNENTIHGYIAPKPRSATSIAIYIIIGIVFVLVYAVVWVKVFRLNLPFIGQ